ncbi:protein TIC 62 [Carex littledalei]|uniref:Protein TIC 62 n=1 Tax=Carex littledalei TaxID=544730 RepID=A0A833RN55_9POAL|nr:protein TIC 62 [Carex littledalei]
MNAVMEACVHCGDVDTARKVFEEMSGPDICGVDCVSYGILLKVPVPVVFVDGIGSAAMYELVRFSYDNLIGEIIRLEGDCHNPRELLKLGFRVRAGVRSSQRAGALVQSVKQMKPVDSTQAPPEERLEIVECDLENQSTIKAAIANASIVICCIGASEKEVFDITGPYRIDYKATSNLIQEATNLKVDHFILLTSLGTGKIGFPAALLNLFWGVLSWKRKAEEELISSGLPYTVAELMACMAKNSKLSYCKVVEVIAETTAPLLPMEQLLSTIPNQRPLPLDPEPEPEPKPELELEPEPEPEPDPVQVSKPVPQSPYTSLILCLQLVVLVELKLVVLVFVLEAD